MVVAAQVQAAAAAAAAVNAAADGQHVGRQYGPGSSATAPAALHWQWLLS